MMFALKILIAVSSIYVVFMAGLIHHIFNDLSGEDRHLLFSQVLPTGVFERAQPWLRVDSPLNDSARLLLSFHPKPYHSWGHHVPLHQWEGVKVYPDSAQHVWSLDMRASAATRILPRHLPRRIGTIKFVNHHCNHPIELAEFPRSLRMMQLYSNQFTGFVNLAGLPPQLEYAELDNNDWDSTVDLTVLPPTLDYLRLNDCKALHGPLDFTKLPPVMTSLGLEVNQFEGPVDLTKLPPKMKMFDINRNKLTGSVDLTKLPSSLDAVLLNSNMFSGTLDLTRLPHKLRLLTLHTNKFGGPLDMGSLPAKLRHLSLRDNLGFTITVPDKRPPGDEHSSFVVEL